MTFTAELPSPGVWQMPAQQWGKKSCVAGWRGFSLCLQKQLPDATGEKQTMATWNEATVYTFKSTADVFHHSIYWTLQGLLLFLILVGRGVYPCWLRTYVGCCLWTGRLYLYWMLCSELNIPLCGGQRQRSWYKNITVAARTSSTWKVSESCCCRARVYATINAVNRETWTRRLWHTRVQRMRQRKGSGTHSCDGVSPREIRLFNKWWTSEVASCVCVCLCVRERERWYGDVGECVCVTQSVSAVISRHFLSNAMEQLQALQVIRVKITTQRT